MNILFPYYVDEIERMDLKEIAIGYIRENLKQIINNSAFKELTKNQVIWNFLANQYFEGYSKSIFQILKMFELLY